jgi:hypothetical protein
MYERVAWEADLLDTVERFVEPVLHGILHEGRGQYHRDDLSHRRRMIEKLYGKTERRIADHCYRIAVLDGDSKEVGFDDRRMLWIDIQRHHGVRAVA